MFNVETFASSFAFRTFLYDVVLVILAELRIVGILHCGDSFRMKAWTSRWGVWLESWLGQACGYEPGEQKSL